MRIRTTLPLLSLCLVGACSSNAGTGEEITGTSAQAITADRQGQGDHGENGLHRHQHRVLSFIAFSRSLRFSVLLRRLLNLIGPIASHANCAR